MSNSFMKTLYITVVSAIIGLSSIARAGESMDITKLNNIIEQTNFIVNNGCSGTLIDLERKLILTNQHCIEGLISVVEEEKTDSLGAITKVRIKRIKDSLVEQHGYDGFTKVSTLSFFAEVVAENKKVDLALLRVKSAALPNKYASELIPEGDAKRGEDVYAVGNPGLMDATVVKGIVSNVNRTFEFPWTGGSKLPMVQFSGGIYGGNSGGALYNEKGQLIGVPAAGFTQANFIGLAIPASIVRNFLKENCFEESFNKNAGANAACEIEKKNKGKKGKE